MDKKKKEKIFIIALLPILAFFIYNSLSTVSKKKKSARQKAEAQKQAPAVTTAEVSTKPFAAKSDQGELPALNEKLLRMQNAIADEPWGRDPFQPPPVDKNDKQPSDWKDFTPSGVIPGDRKSVG